MLAIRCGLIGRQVRMSRCNLSMPFAPLPRPCSPSRRLDRCERPWRIKSMGIAEGRGGARGPENVWGSAATGAVVPKFSTVGRQRWRPIVPPATAILSFSLCVVFHFCSFPEGQESLAIVCFGRHDRPSGMHSVEGFPSVQFTSEGTRAQYTPHTSPNRKVSRDPECAGRA